MHLVRHADARGGPELSRPEPGAVYDVLAPHKVALVRLHPGHLAGEPAAPTPRYSAHVNKAEMGKEEISESDMDGQALLMLQAG